MDEKIEEMVLVVYPWLKEVPIEERKELQENVSGLMVMEKIYNAGYRKESDTAREILTEIKNICIKTGDFTLQYFIELWKKYVE